MQLFFMSAISIPHLSESFFAIAVPQLIKEMSLRIALPQFRNRSFFSSPQLQERNFTALKKVVHRARLNRKLFS